MASLTFSKPDTFPDGTALSVYPPENWPGGSPSGAPVGASVATATVANGEATFKGLDYLTLYVVVGQVSAEWRFVPIVVGAPSSGDTQPAHKTTRQAAVPAANAAHALGTIFSDTEVEAALDVLGQRINDLRARLQAANIIEP